EQIELILNEKLSALPAVDAAKDDGFNPVVQAGPIPLSSEVVKATAYPEGILEVRMEDRRAKNLFSDALVQGMQEVLEHIARTPAYKVVILTGYDHYFASGGSKETLLAIQAGKAKFTDVKIYQWALTCK